MLLLLLACTREPATLAECPDATCLRTLALAGWERDPATITAEIVSMKDPILQLAVVTTVAEAHAGQTQALCKALPKGATRTRCEDLNNRLHLAMPAPAGDPYDQAHSQSPARTVLVPTDTRQLFPSPFAQVPAAPIPCESPLLANTCHEDAAAAAAAAGDPAKAAGICHDLTDPRWRSECSFKAVEGALRTTDGAVAGDIVALCLDAGTFGPNCLAHLAMIVAEGAPSADDPAPDAWPPLTAEIAAVRAALAPLDPGLADRVADRAWSEALLEAYRQVPVVTGDPLDALSPALAPHVRAAAAARLWELEANRTRDAAAWRVRILDVLAARGTTASARKKRSRETPITSLWEAFLPGEESIPTALYLGQARRGVASTPEADAFLCLLEAAARHPAPPVSPMVSKGKPSDPWGPSQALLAGALVDPDPVVRWTAGRLLAAIDDHGQYTSVIAEHPDPLVQAQLRRPRPARSR